MTRRAAWRRLLCAVWMASGATGPLYLDKRSSASCKSGRSSKCSWKLSVRSCASTAYRTGSESASDPPGPAIGAMSCPNIVARSELSACSRWLMSWRLARFCSKWFASHAATIAPSGTVSFITTSSQNWTSRLAFTSARLSPALFSPVMRGSLLTVDADGRSAVQCGHLRHFAVGAIDGVDAGSQRHGELAALLHLDVGHLGFALEHRQHGAGLDARDRALQDANLRLGAGGTQQQRYNDRCIFQFFHVGTPESRGPPRQAMTHYIGVVASLAIRRSTASTQPANLLLTLLPHP